MNTIPMSSYTTVDRNMNGVNVWCIYLGQQGHLQLSTDNDQVTFSPQRRIKAKMLLLPEHIIKIRMPKYSSPDKKKPNGRILILLKLFKDTEIQYITVNKQENIFLTT